MRIGARILRRIDVTGEAFLKELDEKLSFMAYKDRVKVLSFYSDKIMSAANEEEEQRIVDDFGDIGFITDTIKVKYEELTKIRSGGDTISFNPQIVNKLSRSENEGGAADISDNDAFMDPTRSINIGQTGSSGTVPAAEAAKETREVGSGQTKPKRIPVRGMKSSRSEDEGKQGKELWLPDVKGFFPWIMEKLNVPDKFRIPVFIGFLILLAPFIIIMTGLLFLLYAAAIVIILACALVLFLLVLIPAAIGVIDLSYGIIMLFQNLIVALIEIGIGTMIFGVVTAIIGLGYQLIAGVIPAILRMLTSLYKYGIAIIKTLVFGRDFAKRG